MASTQPGTASEAQPASGAAAATTPRKRNEAARQRRLKILLPFLLLLVFLSYAFMPPPVVPSESMEPTLKPGDHIVTMRRWLAYLGGKRPSRGDVLVFDLPYDKLPKEERPADPRDQSATRLPQVIFKLPPGELLVKRVVGLPGETIQVIGGVPYINDKKLPENYQTKPGDPDMDESFNYATMVPLKLGPNDYFMLGDNRDNSEDSRTWGPLHFNQVVGKCLGVLYSEGANGRNVRDARAADAAERSAERAGQDGR